MIPRLRRPAALWLALVVPALFGGPARAAGEAQVRPAATLPSLAPQHATALKLTPVHIPSAAPPRGPALPAVHAAKPAAPAAQPRVLPAGPYRPGAAGPSSNGRFLRTAGRRS